MLEQLAVQREELKHKIMHEFPTVWGEHCEEKMAEWIIRGMETWVGQGGNCAELWMFLKCEENYGFRTNEESDLNIRWEHIRETWGYEFEMEDYNLDYVIMALGQFIGIRNYIGGKDVKSWEN